MPFTDIKHFMNKYKSNFDIFHDLMTYRVREILLIATVYDAYILEQEGQLTERIFGEYFQLNLTTAPRITSVHSEEGAIEQINSRRFDLIIVVGRRGGRSPFGIAEKIRDLTDDIPKILLLSDNSDTPLVYENPERMKIFDNVFVWNGDSGIFLAIIKYIEDKMNADNDTRIGLVRIILLVEDSIRFYSRYMFMLYTQIIKQTQKLIAEENLEEIHKLLRMRARPKILLAKNYEEALELFQKYQSYILTVITDITFPKNGKKEELAGCMLVEKIKETNPELAILMQSSNQSNKHLADKLGAHFIYKYSTTLSDEIRFFIQQNLGFGDFIFRDETMQEYGRARDIKEFIRIIDTIPEQSLMYHANRNHFSAWLMARGEIQFAKSIQPLTVADFQDAGDLRRFIKGVLKTVQVQRVKGRIINLNKSLIGTGGIIMRLSDGLLGGKGRGIAFLNSLIETHVLPRISHEVVIRIPQTFIIGTETFQEFWNNNHLEMFLDAQVDYTGIKQEFLNSTLPLELQRKLYQLLTKLKGPIAVRSSGLFEDSVTNAFSGIYDTFMLPNNHPNIEVRLQQLMMAIKLIYASLFSPQTRAYFKAIDYNLEEERMAIIIQELAGNRFGNYFYPHFSGAAQSFNYYSIANLEPEDGIATIALGLGEYVMNGGKAYFFSPKLPKANVLQEEDLLKESQKNFYALDLRQQNINLMNGEYSTLKYLPMEIAEEHGSLEYLGSTWDPQIQKLRPGIYHKGPRVIDFSYILKFDFFPLAEIIEILLKTGEDALGTHVEIEFAVTLNKDIHSGQKGVFYPLQIKPLLSHDEHLVSSMKTYANYPTLINTSQGVGNGIVSDIYDIVVADLEAFSRGAMASMVAELDELNTGLLDEKRRYILIGPGRWGSRDQWLGIPVKWQHISSAACIVEVGLPEFTFEPSLGSHFFHNITAMNIGYFMIPHQRVHEQPIWNKVKSYQLVKETSHFKWVRSSNPLILYMSGKNQDFRILESIGD
ncbi:MAG: PEP/pyruvate-binding domain-containing protein [Calditrichia bacterium]